MRAPTGRRSPFNPLRWQPPARRPLKRRLLSLSLSLSRGGPAGLRGQRSRLRFSSGGRQQQSVASVVLTGEGASPAAQEPTLCAREASSWSGARAAPLAASGQDAVTQHMAERAKKQPKAGLCLPTTTKAREEAREARELRARDHRLLEARAQDSTLSLSVRVQACVERSARAKVEHQREPPPNQLLASSVQKQPASQRRSAKSGSRFLILAPKKQRAKVWDSYFG